MQEKTERESEDQRVEIKGKKCFSKPSVRVAAVVVGIALAAVVISSVYAAGVFDSGPELPEVMEGEATFSSDHGEGEFFHVIIDYKRKLIQLTSVGYLPSSFPLSGRRLMSFEENDTANGTNINATKIVIQDYNTQKKYFIVPEHGNSTTKCIYTAIEGDMIPRHLLKHATLKSENIEGNLTHVIFQVDNDTEVDVYRAKGLHGKIYEVYLHLPNGTIHMRSKEHEMNFTDYKQLNCYKYIEENDTIEEAFYQSNDSKLFTESQSSPESSIIEKNIRELSTNFTHQTNDSISLSNASLLQQPSSVVKRRRRGIGWRNGGLDWWYGNWCGAYQGGYENNPKPHCRWFCSKTKSYVNRACRDCLPPQDGLDEACMEHDRCLVNHDRGPWWCQPIGNRCKCDSPFVWRAYNQIYACSSRSCRSHARQVFWTFYYLLSCWYPARFCFPWFRFVCGCKWCSCPRIIVYWKCIFFKACAFFGSGSVYY